MVKRDRPSFLRDSWEMYFTEMFNIAYLLTLDDDVAMGIVVEAFAGLYKKLEKDIHGENNIKSFLYTTVRGRSIDYRKNEIYGQSNNV